MRVDCVDCTACLPPTAASCFSMTWESVRSSAKSRQDDNINPRIVIHLQNIRKDSMPPFSGLRRKRPRKGCQGFAFRIDLFRRIMFLQVRYIKMAKARTGKDPNARTIGGTAKKRKPWT